MEREQRLELIQRSLGIKHKLKVQDSMKQPETHEEIAVMMLSRWDLEDELKAIEEILTEDRGRKVAGKRSLLIKDYPVTTKKKKG